MSAGELEGGRMGIERFFAVLRWVKGVRCGKIWDYLFLFEGWFWCVRGMFCILVKVVFVNGELGCVEDVGLLRTAQPFFILGIASLVTDVALDALYIDVDGILSRDLEIEWGGFGASLSRHDLR